MKNSELAVFCISKLGTPYIMGTNGKEFTQSMYNDLCKRNPAGWFTDKRKSGIKKWIGIPTTDCHGLIEWFVRTRTGASYDTTADGAFTAAKVKGDIKTIPEMPGVCVRYKGHVGVYIGGGYVVEARGYDYGVCITKLAGRGWTNWYQHPKIEYTDKTIPAPYGTITNRSSKTDIMWLQINLNRAIIEGKLQIPLLVVDGVWGTKTLTALRAFKKLAADKSQSCGEETQKELTA